MWAFLLDPATQNVAILGALALLGWVAFDLAQEVRAPTTAARFAPRRARRASPAPPLRAGPGPMLEVWTDAAGRLRGRVLRGPCRGEALDDLSREDLDRQAAYARAHDPRSAATLDAYIRARFAAPPPREGGAMTRAEALRELGLSEAVGAGDVHAAWVKAIKRHHPDHGGDPAKAARINAARDVLEG